MSATSTPNAAPQFVYFIQAGEDGPIKIGFSSDVDKRLASLQTGNHLALRVLARVEVRDAEDVEAALHEQFADLRITGEWFKCDSRLLDVISAIDMVAFRDPRSVSSKRRVEAGDMRASQGVPDRLARSLDLACAGVQVFAGGDQWWVVAWSHVQGYSHIEPLSDYLEKSREVLLSGRGSPTDYVVLFIVLSASEASRVAAAVEPWLRAMRIVRNSGVLRGA